MKLDGKLTTVRPQILRQYYDKSLGAFPDPERFADATFAEYYSLLKIEAPGVTPHTAAGNSPRYGVPHFLSELEFLEKEDKRDDTKRGFSSWISRQPVGEVLSEELAEHSTRISFESVKDVRGWAELGRFEEIASLSLADSGTTDLAYCDPPIELEELRLHGCAEATIRAALQSTQPTHISIMFSKCNAVDARLLSTQHRLEELTIIPDLVRNFDALSKTKVRRVNISNIHIDPKFTATLKKLRSTLEELRLLGTEPFLPEVIPLRSLKKLKRLSVSVSPEHREAWLETACANPHIYFLMSSTATDDEEPKQKVTVAEIYRDIDILEIKKGKKTTFEVSGEMTEYAEERGFEGDNGDLEDELKARAKAAKVRGLKWSSEGDTLVAMATKIEAARWVIDAIHEA